MEMRQTCGNEERSVSVVRTKRVECQNKKTSRKENDEEKIIIIKRRNKRIEGKTE